MADNTASCVSELFQEADAWTSISLRARAIKKGEGRARITTIASKIMLSHRKWQNSVNEIKPHEALFRLDNRYLTKRLWYQSRSTAFTALNNVQKIHRTIIMSTKPLSEGWIAARKGEYSAYKTKVITT